MVHYQTTHYVDGERRDLETDVRAALDWMERELLTHVAADDGPVEDVERSEQGRGAGLVERKHDGVGRRIDIEPDHVAQLVDEVRIVRELELPITVRLKPRAPSRYAGPRWR